MYPAAVKDDVIGLFEEDQVVKPPDITICARIGDFQALKSIVIGARVRPDDPRPTLGSGDTSH